MRCDKKPFELLIRLVCEGEDNPVGPGSGFSGCHRDPPYDAVTSGRRRDLDGFTIRA